MEEIEKLKEEIASLKTEVKELSNTNSQHAYEIDLKVSADDIISAINLSEERVRISANKIEFPDGVIKEYDKSEE